MSEPTLGDIVSLIQSLERKMDQRFDQLEQAVHELKDDIKVHREEIDFLNDQMHAQNKKIWQTQKLYRELYKEVKSLKTSGS